MAGLRHVVDMERGRGHCGVPLEKALRETVELLDVECDLVAETIETAVSDEVLIEEELDGRRVLFEPWLHRAETRIAETLARLADELPQWHDIEPDEAITSAEAESGVPLDAVQRQAVSLALRSRAVVITGGPGVGKTTLVRALLTVFQSAELSVSLAAPTGRAAKRLSESTGGAAQTLHRLLEMSPHSGEFQRNAENPLETDAVIIDEASMVDVPLFGDLLEAMPPHAGIVVVGDADQLPSIGPGQVLHDVLASQRVPAIRLTEIHRQADGSEIVQNAHRIHRGEMPRFGKQPDGSDMFFFSSDSPEKAVARVVDLVTVRIPEKFGLPSRDVQVLAPMRKGSGGVDALNRALQDALNPPSRHKARVERPGGVVFGPGDKLMQTENNYEKGVFNGDIGVIATINASEERFTVDFGADLIVDYTLHEADQLTLAYATTIHKAQGSEYPAVVIVLLPQHHIMLRRNLLYTAVTRGRRLVVMVGDLSAIRTAVRTGRGGERCTRLAGQLSSTTTGALLAR
jgi:exodeoxyribonuclease V alpha subunit